MNSRSRKITSAVLAAAMMTTVAPSAVLAEPISENVQVQNVQPVPVDSETELRDAITNATGQTLIQLTQGFSLSSTLKIEQGKEIILDLNGNTIETSKTITVNGTLTIQDSQNTTGMINGTIGPMIVINSTGTVNLESGTVQTTKYGAIKTSSGSHFNMTGGTVIGNPAFYAYNGTISITGGKVGLTEGSTYQSIINTSAQINIGTSGNTSQADPWIEGLKVENNTVVNLYSGYVKDLTGTLGTGSVVSCAFGNDVSDKLPGGYKCVNENGVYVAKPLNQEDAVAQVGDTLYASVSSAAKSMTADQTLKLLQDVVVDSSNAAISINVPNATVDLNGHSVTNTNEKGTGIALEVNYKNSVPDMLAKVVNNGATQATVTAAIPLSFSSGNSENTLDISIEGDVVLNSTTGQTYDLGNGSRLQYSESAAAAMGNGGFKATAAGSDVDYIYSSLVQAINASADGNVELLNDYTGSDALIISAGKKGVLDMNGHTYTMTAADEDRSAVYIVDEDANCDLTLKNGVIESNTDGINAIGNDISITLDNVKMTAKGVYGAASNGTYSGNNLTLKNGASIVTTNEYGVGIYWPSGNGTVTIEDSQVSGHTGIQICAGNLVVNGEKTAITATGTPVQKGENDGSILDGAAISIVDRKGYQELGSVQIHDGVFKASDSSSAVKAYSFNNDDKTEGAFNNTTKTIVSIDGGNYSQSVDKALLADSINAELYSTNADAPFSYYTSVEAAQNAAGSNDIVIDLTDENADPTTSFDLTLDYGSGEKTVLPVSDGTTITLPTASKDGYRFLGWSDGTTTYKAGDRITISAAMTLTAQWEKIEYNGSYNYEVTVGKTENGTVTVAKEDKWATGGDEVTITVTPDKGYMLDDLTITTKGGKEVEVKDNGDGTYTFTMPESAITISATFAEDPDYVEPEPSTSVADIFDDIQPGAWYEDAVQFAYDEGIMTGTSKTTFEPNTTTTRGMIVSILHRLEGNPVVTEESFSDVSADDWYGKAVAWASSKGIVGGYGDNTFQPNKAITREEMASILYRYAQYKDQDVSARADLSKYTDAGQLGAWAEEVMQWANAEGLINGMTEDTLDPQGNATRAQVAAMFQRYLNK